MTQTSSKYDIFKTIGELFDENERLRSKIAVLESRIHVDDDRVMIVEIGDVEQALIEAGIKSVIDDEFRWKSVSVERSDDTGEIVVESYGHWKGCREVKVPDTVAKADFVEYIEPHLRAYYEAKRSEAVEDFKESERDE